MRTSTANILPSVPLAPVEATCHRPWYRLRSFWPEWWREHWRRALLSAAGRPAPLRGLWSIITPSISSLQAWP